MLLWYVDYTRIIAAMDVQPLMLNRARKFEVDWIELINSNFVMDGMISSDRVRSETRNVCSISD